MKRLTDAAMTATFYMLAIILCVPAFVLRGLVVKS